MLTLYDNWGQDGGGGKAYSLLLFDLAINKNVEVSGDVKILSLARLADLDLPLQYWKLDCEGQIDRSIP
jgi:hypothetical protein